MATPTALASAIAKASVNIGKAVGTDKLYDAVDRAKRLCGFKIPALAYQILICCDHLPFAIHGKSAPPHVGKTYLCIQEGCWAIQDGCMCNFTDTEIKQSVDMIPSFLKKALPKELQPNFKVVEAYSIEDWQVINTQLSKIAIENKHLPKADRFGIYSITDSLLGKGTSASREALMKEGFAPGRGYKEEVLMIKNYVESYTNEGSFMAWATVQHAKKSLDPNAKGPLAFTVAGGDAPRFASMTHILMTRADEWTEVDTDGMPIAGHNIKMQTIKNGLGPDRRVIYAGLRWRTLEDEAGQPYQVTWFDWNWSLAWFLCQQVMENKYTPTTIKKNLQEIIKFSVKNQNNVECAALSPKPMTYSEFGAALEADPKIREQLQDLFGVKRILHYKDMDLAVASVVKKRGRPAKADKGKKGDVAAEATTDEQAQEEAFAEPAAVINGETGEAVDLPTDKLVEEFKNGEG